MRRFFQSVASLVVILLLVSCSSGASKENELSGPILVWHPEIVGGEEVWDELLIRFTAIYPDVQVVRKAFPGDKLQEAFVNEAKLGFGPNLLVGGSLWVPEFADNDLIVNLHDRDDIELTNHLSSAVKTLRYTPNGSQAEGLYGLPVSLQTFVLFYNKDLVDEDPPVILSELLTQAATGKKVALDTNFAAAFWGIPAFGGQLLNEEGRVVLDQGGFANWLGWLKNAQNEPNIILSNNEDALLDLFKGGELTYYVGFSARLPGLEAALGEGVIGVAPLPAGPNGSPAGPLLITNALMFNAASSPAQLERTLRLAQFLTNEEQQTKLALQAGLVPANPQVRIDPRVAPALAAVVAQTKTAIPALNLPQVFDVISAGDDIYVKALAGEMGLNEAARDLTQQVNIKNGFESKPTVSEGACSISGDIQVWHSWPEPDATVLGQIANGFIEQCPLVSIELQGATRDDLPDRFWEAASLSQAPDLLLIDNQYVARLAAAELVNDLTNDVDSEFLQRYVPGAQETMRFKGKLYGLPISMESMALYYNTDLVTDPARDLTDLLNQAAPEQQVVVQLGFYRAYWGIQAFGGQMFNADDQIALNEGGFSDWLTWLQKAEDQPGITLINDQDEALALFAQGKAAYLTGEKWMLNPLQEVLGREKVGVVSLPAGPKGEAGPFLVVEAALINQASGAIEQTVAFEFAKYMTELENQTLLMEQANRVPANVNVDTTAYPAIGGFLEQARTSFVPPNDLAEPVLTLMEQGQQIYIDVLEGGREPAEVVEDFVKSMGNTLKK